MKNQQKSDSEVEFSDHATNEKIPETVHQILLGSLLGDMHCKIEVRNARIEESHAIDQGDYIAWKYKTLNKCFRMKLYAAFDPYCMAKEKVHIRKPQIRMRSAADSTLNGYHDLFYENRKKIIRCEMLNQLNALGLAVWYCDDGYYDPENKSITIHTEGYMSTENELLQQWFAERWGIRPNFKLPPSKKSFALRFSKMDTEKFLTIVKSDILKMPRVMWYKLGHLWDGNDGTILAASENKKRRMKIYQSRAEVKLQKRVQARKYYQLHRETVLARWKQYQTTSQYRTYLREYRRRPEVIVRTRHSQKNYRQKPETKKKLKQYQREYRKRPQVRQKLKIYNQRAKQERQTGGKH